jgi:hypothetical protein
MAAAAVVSRRRPADPITDRRSTDMTEQTTTPAIDTEATIPVTVSLNVASIVDAVTSYSYDGYSDQVHPDGRLAHLVIERVAALLVDRLLDDTLKAAVRDAVAAQVDEAVRARLDEPIVPVDRWGSSAGQAVTLREQIGKAVEEWPTIRSGSNGDKNKLSEWIKEHVDKAVREDLNGTLREARDEVVGTLKARAAEILAETAAAKAGVR